MLRPAPYAGTDEEREAELRRSVAFPPLARSRGCHYADRMRSRSSLCAAATVLLASAAASTSTRAQDAQATYRVTWSYELEGGADDPPTRLAAIGELVVEAADSVTHVARAALHVRDFGRHFRGAAPVPLSLPFDPRLVVVRRELDAQGGPLDLSIVEGASPDREGLFRAIGQGCLVPSAEDPTATRWSTRERRSILLAGDELSVACDTEVTRTTEEGSPDTEQLAITRTCAALAPPAGTRAIETDERAYLERSRLDPLACDAIEHATVRVHPDYGIDVVAATPRTLAATVHTRFAPLR